MNDLWGLLIVLIEVLAVAGFLLVLFDAFVGRRKHKKGRTLTKQDKYLILAVAVFLAVRVVLPDILAVIK